MKPSIHDGRTPGSTTVLGGILLVLLSMLCLFAPLAASPRPAHAACKEAFEEAGSVTGKIGDLVNLGSPLVPESAETGMSTVSKGLRGFSPLGDGARVLPCQH